MPAPTIDVELSELLAMTRRMRLRVVKWFDDTDHLDDIARYFPDQRITGAMALVAKVVLDAARLDIERRHKAKGKPGDVPEMTDEQLEAEERKFIKEAMRRMPVEEIERCLEERSMES